MTTVFVMLIDKQRFHANLVSLMEYLGEIQKIADAAGLQAKISSLSTYFYFSSDFIARLDKLKELKDGWHNGEGKQIPEERIEWLKGQMVAHYYFRFGLPSRLSIFPVLPNAELAHGHVRFEWNSSRLPSMGVDLESELGYFHQIPLPEDVAPENEWRNFEERYYDLNDPVSWREIMRLVAN